MMKRRIFAAALSAALLLSLAACGGGTAPGGGDNGTSSSTPGSGSGSGSGSTNGSSAGSSNGGNTNGGSAGSSNGESTNGGSTGSSNGGGTSSQITLTLNRNNIELNTAGATFKLRCTVDPDIYDGLAVFSSSDTNVATVDESGTVTAVAPGKATITVQYDSATATASVNCNWRESEPAPDEPGPSKPEEGPSTPDNPPTPGNVDLSAFYTTIIGKYEFAMLELADGDILENFYAGISAIDAEQRLIYICAMSMNNGEIGLVQVKDSKDVDAVKAIFQARIDAQASGGAWYPQAVDSWTNNARVVSNGNYVMMVVHENCDDIVKAFNDLF